MSEVHLGRLFSHDDTRVKLPERGLVVITGPNGAGKSSLAECVSVAVWGKTLRGTPAWHKTGTSTAFCAIDNLCVKRSRAGSASPALDWFDPDGEDDTTYPTTTKAQAALESQVGPWDVWRRARVFSSSDAAHFSRATDGERKRLLEAILGLGRFDPALAACRADLKTTKHAVAAKRTELAKYRALVASFEQRAKDATEALKLLGKEPTAQLDIAEEAVIGMTAAGIAGTRADIAACRDRLRGDRELVVEAGAASRAAQQRHQRLEGASCPVCVQPIPAELRAELQASVEATRQRADQLHRQLTEAEGACHQELADLEEELEELRGQHTAQVRARDASKRAAGEVKRWQDQKKHHDLKLSQGKLGAKTVAKDIARAEGELVALEHTEGVLVATERVLGLKGVRAHVLGAALGGLEAVANDWLVRLQRPDLQLRLNPYSTTKKGDVQDAIGMEVDGAGHGYGYLAASAGERRRVDVALVFSLGAIAGAAAGADDDGTLWMDEVFDCLDDEGEAAVVDVLEELSRERCVVVVTHSKTLAQLLPASQHLRVEAGTVKRVA